MLGAPEENNCRVYIGHESAQPRALDFTEIPRGSSVIKETKLRLHLTSQPKESIYCMLAYDLAV